MRQWTWSDRRKAITWTNADPLLIEPLIVKVYQTFARFEWKLKKKNLHDDVIKWKHFTRYWLFVRGIHRSPVNSPHKGQLSGALMFSLICVWINGWANNREAGDLRRYCAHYDVIVMKNDVCRATMLLRSHCADQLKKSFPLHRPLIFFKTVVKSISNISEGNQFLLINCSRSIKMMITKRTCATRSTDSLWLP